MKTEPEEWSWRQQIKSGKKFPSSKKFKKYENR